MRTNFYIQHKKYQHYSDKALDWKINSWNFKVGTPEHQICLLKADIYKTKAKKHFTSMQKELWKTLKD